MKYLPLVLFATVITSFSFSHCRKAESRLATRFDSLRRLNGEHNMGGRRTGTVSGPDWSAGGAWVAQVVDDSIKTKMSLFFLTEDTVFVGFDPGGTCIASGKYQLKELDPAAKVAIYKRFGWKEKIEVFYATGKLLYVGGQNGIHEGRVAELRSI